MKKFNRLLLQINIWRKLMLVIAMATEMMVLMMATTMSMEIMMLDGPICEIFYKIWT